MLTYLYCKREHKRLSRTGKIVLATIAAIILVITMVIYHEPMATFTGSRGLTDNMILYTGMGALSGLNYLYWLWIENSSD